LARQFQPGFSAGHGAEDLNVFGVMPPASTTIGRVSRNVTGF
jgi:hypothetical protein